jgi:DegV family protein with EDD domain
MTPSPGSGGRVAVVTDSTSYLPAEVVTLHGLCVVPLQVVVAGRSYDEGGRTGPRAIAEALRRYVPVTTSRPAPHALLAAYRKMAEQGAVEVVSIHLSAEMSGTYDSATLAARDAPIPVHVVDSRSMGMGLGFAVIAAAEAAAAGGSGGQVAAAARRRAERTSSIFYVDTLEHLRRGGRIGAAQALLGSALAVKPLLQLHDGRVVPLEKVRTSARAIARLEEIAVARAGSEPVDVAVHHLDSPDKASELADRLAKRLPALVNLHVSEVGAVIGAHVGPGMLAIAISPR